MKPSSSGSQGSPSGSDNTHYQQEVDRTDPPQALNIVDRPSYELVESQGPITWEMASEAFLTAALDSVNTRRAYRRHLRNASPILGQRAIGDLTGVELSHYRSLVISLDVAPASQAQALAAVRSFLLWSGDMGGHRLPTRLIRTALRAPTVSVAARYNVVSDKEANAMFRAAENPRDAALLGVMLGAGLRVTEVSTLKVSDIMEDMDGRVA